MAERSSRFLIFTAGFLAGAFAVGAWFIGDIHTPIFAEPENQPEATTSSSVIPKDESGAVSVKDQSAGQSVLVDSVTVPPPGVWVAVREMEGTTLGNVLGAARAHGPMSNLTIPLLRPTLAGHTYAIVLYRDDGDRTFDVDSDSVYVDFDTGSPVVVSFETK